MMMSKYFQKNKLKETMSFKNLIDSNSQGETTLTTHYTLVEAAL